MFGMERVARHMGIGDLSRLAGVKPTTIRWYEAEGWLPPPARTEGGHRTYGEAHVHRLGFIRHSRELGFSMAHVRSLLDLADRRGADCSAAHAIAEVDARMRRLEALRAELQRMADSCVGGQVDECRIIETLADFEQGHCANPAHGHEGGAASWHVPPARPSRSVPSHAQLHGPGLLGRDHQDGAQPVLRPAGAA